MLSRPSSMVKPLTPYGTPDRLSRLPRVARPWGSGGADRTQHDLEKADGGRTLALRFAAFRETPAQPQPVEEGEEFEGKTLGVDLELAELRHVGHRPRQFARQFLLDLVKAAPGARIEQHFFVDRQPDEKILPRIVFALEVLG